MIMPKDEKDQPQTEQTPKGLTVPIPKRGTFFENLRRVTKPDAPEKPDDDSAGASP
jgi:hypothetical protein